MLGMAGLRGYGVARIGSVPRFVFLLRMSETQANVLRPYSACISTWCSRAPGCSGAEGGGSFQAAAAQSGSGSRWLEAKGFPASRAPGAHVTAQDTGALFTPHVRRSAHNEIHTQAIPSLAAELV